MSVKILSVDDSNAVRRLIKSCFSKYDCQVLEATNGKEGLAMVIKERPDVVLLDVTMPVMDGLEMLTLLRKNPEVKTTPVIMLTAESGKEMVIKIAKLGIRDYIVKPFKKGVVISKTKRIVKLKISDDYIEGEEGIVKREKLPEGTNVLIVDEQPAITDQIREKIQIDNFHVHNVATPDAAQEFCKMHEPDLIVISLSLPDKEPYSLFQWLRANLKNKSIPVFALVVKMKVDAQNKARDLGFNAIITKPIDFRELEIRIANAAKIDLSGRYFQCKGESLFLTIPDEMNDVVDTNIRKYLRNKVAESVDMGCSQVVIDMMKLENVDKTTQELLFEAVELCEESGIKYILYGSDAISEQFKNFEESSSWVFYSSLEEAGVTVAT